MSSPKGNRLSIPPTFSMFLKLFIYELTPFSGVNTPIKFPKISSIVLALLLYENGHKKHIKFFIFCSFKLISIILFILV